MRKGGKGTKVQGEAGISENPWRGVTIGMCGIATLNFPIEFEPRIELIELRGNFPGGKVPT